MGTCQRIHVLDFGRIIADGTPAEVQANPRCVPPTSAATPTTSPRRADPDAEADAARRRVVAAEVDASHARRRRTRHRPRRRRCSSCAASRGLRHHRRAATASTSRCRPGRCYALLGPERRGQVDHARRWQRADRADGRRGALFGEPRGHGASARRAGPRRAVPRSRGPRHLPEPHRRREPAHGDVRRRRRSRACSSGRSRASRASRSGASSSRARCRVASSRCSRWRGRWRPIPKVLLLDELSMGLAPLDRRGAVRGRAHDRGRGPVDPHRRAVRARGARRGRQPRRSCCTGASR